MEKYEEELKPIIKTLIDEYGLDETLDYLSGITEDINFENYRKMLRQKELEAETEKELLDSLDDDDDDDYY